MPDNSLLKPGERYDDLERNGLYIIQNPEKFCFGMDAVLLSSFAKAKRTDKVLDMCTGTGIIPILMSAKTNATNFTAIEIQEESADMARRSIEANALQSTIKVVTGDIKDNFKLFGNNAFNVITCNPPYMPIGDAIVNPSDSLAIARHEVLCTLSDIAKNAASVLKTGGHFYMVHRPHRLVEVINELTKVNLEPKRMRFVHPYADKQPNMVLIEAVKDAGHELRIENPLIVYKAVGEYSDEMKAEYGY